MYGNRGYGALIKAELQPTEVDPCFKTFLNQNLVWKIDTFVILELSCVGERVDESPIYEDHFGVTRTLVSLSVYEKSRFEETLILGQISRCFFRFYIVRFQGNFIAWNKALLTLWLSKI